MKTNLILITAATLALLASCAAPRPRCRVCVVANDYGCRVEARGPKATQVAYHEAHEFAAGNAAVVAVNTDGHRRATALVQREVPGGALLLNGAP